MRHSARYVFNKVVFRGLITFLHWITKMFSAGTSVQKTVLEEQLTQLEQSRNRWMREVSLEMKLLNLIDKRILDVKTEIKKMEADKNANP